MEPPPVSIGLATVLASLQVPVQWVTRRMADAGERRLVESMYTELKQTGRVSATLSADLHHSRRTGTRCLAHRNAPTARTTSVGTASRCTTPPAVNGPADAARRASLLFGLGEPDRRGAFHRTENRQTTGEDWYPHGGRPTAAGTRDDQPRRSASAISPTRTCSIGKIRPRWSVRFPGCAGHDAQILVACGYCSRPRMVAEANPEIMRKAVDRFVETSEGRRVLRNGSPPDRAEIESWIRNAQQSYAPPKAA